MGFELNNKQDKQDKQDNDNDRRPTGEVNDSSFTVESVKDYWLNSEAEKEKFVCQILGDDGTGKSGIALDYLSDEDIESGKRALIIDLDGGNSPLVQRHHKERCERLGRDVSDVYLVRNPIEEDSEGNIDYFETFKTIRSGVFLAKNAWADLNLKYVVFDGLTSALKFAEQQMRLEKNIDAEGGVKLKYWLVRNKIFKELLLTLKSLPISVFFIGHDDFIEKQGLNDDDMSSIKKSANAMMHQRIICERRDEGDQVRFSATITKSKYNAHVEGKTFDFLTVDKEEETVDWSTESIFEELL